MKEEQMRELISDVSDLLDSFSVEEDNPKSEELLREASDRLKELLEEKR